MFSAYSELVPVMADFFRANLPKAPGDSDFAYRQAIKARALDSVRGMLPAASLSNVGVYGTGQAYEALLLRMRSLPLPEARSYADMMLLELRKVIPSFLKRVDLADRGELTSRYMADNRDAMDEIARRTFGDAVGGPVADDTVGGPVADDTVELVDFDPDGETKMIAAMLYPHTSLAERTVEARIRVHVRAPSGWQW